MKYVYLFRIALLYCFVFNFYVCPSDNVKVYSYSSRSLTPTYFFLKTDEQSNCTFEFYYSAGPESVIGRWNIEKDTLSLLPSYIYDSIYEEKITIDCVDSMSPTVITIPERYLIVNNNLFLIVEDYYENALLEPAGDYLYFNGDSINGTKTTDMALKPIKHSKKDNFVQQYEFCDDNKKRNYLFLKTNPFNKMRNNYEYFRVATGETIIGIWREENDVILLFPQYIYCSIENKIVCSLFQKESERPIRYEKKKNKLKLFNNQSQTHMPFMLKRK